jgi:hypothetical protein
MLSVVRFSTLASKQVYALTGVPAEMLLTLRETATLTQLNRGRKPALTVLDQLLLVLVALRTNLTERALAALFGVSQPTAHRVIATRLPQLAELFNTTWPPGPQHLLIDGTLIPVHDQTRTAKSKNYRRSVNTQIVATTDKHIVHIGAAWPGNRHDIIVARATITPPEGTVLLSDGAYRTFPGARTPPPRNTPQQRRRHIQVRARIEHVIARMKDWQILRQCRRKGNAINHALHAVAYLYNQRRQL